MEDLAGIEGTREVEVVCGYLCQPHEVVKPQINTDKHGLA